MEQESSQQQLLLPLAPLALSQMTNDSCQSQHCNSEVISHNNNKEWTFKEIDEIYQQIIQKYDEMEYERFQYYMSNHCDKVISESKQIRMNENKQYMQQRLKRRRVSSNNNITLLIDDVKNTEIPVILPNPLPPPRSHQQQQEKQSKSMFTVRHRKHGSSHADSMQSVPTNMINSGDLKIPTYSFCLPISEPYHVEDQEELTFVPVIDNYHDELLSRRNVLSMHKTSYREDLVVYGAEIVQVRKNEIIDTLLQRLFVKIDDESEQLRVPQPTHNVWEIIAKVTKEKYGRIRRRLKDLESVSSPGKETRKDSNTSDHDGSRRNKLDLQYEKATDDFRTLWCRQCFVYDCNLHGIFDKPTVCVQTMLAKAREREGHWQKSLPDNDAQELLPYYSTFGDISTLHEVGKTLFKQLYSIYEGDTTKIAYFLRVPISVVEEHLSSLDAFDLLDVKPPMRLDNITKKGTKYFSVKNYNIGWSNKYRDTKIFPIFYPCLHSDLCNELNCTCIDNHFFCTTACSWNKYSQNFFRGCDCKANCGNACTCFLAKRECDPNLCACTRCTDPVHEPVTTQRCRNDSLTMNRNPPLLIGKSSVSGWGLFNRHALKAGDFVGKYIGELMSQDEADRRGLISDARESTYLFLISSDRTLDASRKGNNLRFMNHSDTPNVEPRTMFVKGEQQIGFYAKTNIPEQTELFFDYNFKSVCDDKLTDLLQLQLPWMKKDSKPLSTTTDNAKSESRKKSKKRKRK